MVGGLHVLGDVGPPEPVDRLFRVADDEEPPSERPQPGPVATLGGILIGVMRIGGEPHGDLELDRVGVLELVEQDPLVSAV